MIHSFKTFDESFDEQNFVEQFHPDYNCNEIAAIDDISCVLDNDYDEEKEKTLAKSGYFEMSHRELEEELSRLQGKVLAEAMLNYLKINYGYDGQHF